MRKPNALWCLLFLSATCPSLALAGSFTLTPVQASGGAGQVASPDFELAFAGDGRSIASQTRYVFDSTRFTASAQNVGDGQCSAQADGQINVLLFPFSFTVLPANPQVICRITMTIKPGVAPGDYDLNLDAQSTLCSDELGDPVTPCTGAPGADAIRVLATPIAYLPTQDTDGHSDGAAELVLPAVAFGATTSANIQVVPGSSPADLTCAASGGFELLGGGSQRIETGGSPQPVAVRCQALGSSFQGTLTCQEADVNGGPPRVRLWDLVCTKPNGTGSEFSSPWAAGDTVMFTGAQGLEADRSIPVHNLGNASLELSDCQTQHAEVQVAASLSVAAGGTAELLATCALPISLAPVNGQISCQSNDVDEPLVQWNYQCLSVVDAVFTDGMEVSPAP